MLSLREFERDNDIELVKDIDAEWVCESVKLQLRDFVRLNDEDKEGLLLNEVLKEFETDGDSECETDAEFDPLSDIDVEVETDVDGEFDAVPLKLLESLCDKLHDNVGVSDCDALVETDAEAVSDGLVVVVGVALDE